MGTLYTYSKASLKECDAMITITLYALDFGTGSYFIHSLSFISFGIGTFPNIGRTAIINVGEIVVYDVVKDQLIASRLMADGVPCHFTAAIAAGFTATLIASPVDVIKTR